MILHFVGIGALILFVVLCAFYPFLPGEYDPFALPLSALAQTVGSVGLLLVPVGVSWLVYETRKRSRSRKNLATTPRRYYFSLASLVVSSIVAMSVSFVALMSTGISLALFTLALWIVIVLRLARRVKLMKDAESERFNPAPLYLVCVFSLAFVSQALLASTAKEFSRNRAIAQSEEMITDIERYRSAYGRYPSFMGAVNKDYKPSVAGIERFHYAPNGDAYNLYFEQPASLFDFGIREFVVYNRLGEHIMVSHAAWVVAGAPDQLEARQGWHSVHDAARPHWKYFWFD